MSLNWRSPENGFGDLRNTRLPQPFLKWAGGKKQLLGQFDSFFPKKIDGYVEPFVGSGAVFFHISERYCLKSVTLGDGNSELINTYEAVRDDVEKLNRQLSYHRRMHSQEYYRKVREMKPKSLVGRAARLIYLNKTCYNGLYRVNSKGRFNVPMGRYKNPSIFDAVNLRSVSNVLQGVRLKVCHFSEFAHTGRRGEFFYLDPPYHPVSKTSSFTNYTANAFTESDQRHLAEVFQALNRKGCFLMLSNSDCDFIRNLYGNFRIETVRARRAINSRANGRGKINELLVLNY